MSTPPELTERECAGIELALTPQGGTFYTVHCPGCRELVKMRERIEARINECETAARHAEKAGTFTSRQTARRLRDDGEEFRALLTGGTDGNE